MIPLLLYAQQSGNNNETTKKIFIQEILQQCLEADGEQLMILGADVFSHFGLDEEYDTPLKKKTFMATPEYKDMEKKLEALKTELRKTQYFVAIKIGENSSQYDIKTGGFVIPLNATIMSPSVMDYDLKFHLFGLPIKIYNFGQYGKLYNRNCIFLKMGEKTALEIENSRDNCIAYLIFNVIGISTVSIAGNVYEISPKELSGQYSGRTVPKCQVKRLVIANSNGEVLFDLQNIKGNQ